MDAFVTAFWPCYKSIMEVGGPWAPFSRSGLECPFSPFTASGRTSVRCQKPRSDGSSAALRSFPCSSSKNKFSVQCQPTDPPELDLRTWSVYTSSREQAQEARSTVAGDECLRVSDKKRATLMRKCLLTPPAAIFLEGLDPLIAC